MPGEAVLKDRFYRHDRAGYKLPADIPRFLLCQENASHRPMRIRGGVDLAKEKVTLKMEEGELALLKAKYNTDNQSRIDIS